MSSLGTPSEVNFDDDDYPDEYGSGAEEFNIDISHQMRVPNKISFANDYQYYQQQPPMMANGGAAWNPNVNMHVPERILVAGREQHIGTRAPPREIAFFNQTMPAVPDPGEPRVATPPRTLTLDRYPFPSFGQNSFEESKVEKIPVVQSKKLDLNDPDMGLSMVHNDSMALIGGGEGLTISDEVLHLRRQMAKLNRKVMALEQEQANFLHKEKLLYMAGIAYFLFKAIIWMNRS